MSIGLNTSNNTVRDFNSVMTASQTGKTVPPQMHKVENENEAKAIVSQLSKKEPEINGVEALRNAEVSGFAQELRAQVPARHTFKKSAWNIFKFFGRCVMKACHTVRYAFAPSKKSRAQLQEKLQKLHPESYGKNGRTLVGTLKAGESAPTFTCTSEELGAAMGLRGKLKMKPFTADEIEKIREGQFELSDIKQNPNLENCWFLGALAAFLGTKGPGAIQELISLPPSGDIQGNPPVAQVRLGGEIYDVPLAKLRGDGGSGVSASKPWVTLLETAMQMHLMNLYKLQGAAGMHVKNQPSDKVDMSFNDPDIALATLLGAGITGKNNGNPRVDTSDHLFIQTEADYFEPEISKASVTAVKEALKDGRPVILITPDSYGLSLSTGVSPNHTLAVLDVVDAKDGAYFQVLDPYGRAVMINANIMKDGGTITMEQAPAAPVQQPQGRDSLASTNARYEADIDRQKDMF